MSSMKALIILAIAAICLGANSGEARPSSRAALSNIKTMKNYSSNIPNNDFYIRGSDCCFRWLSIKVRDVVLALDTNTRKWTIDYLHFNVTQSRGIGVPWPVVYIVLVDQNGQPISPYNTTAGSAGSFKVDHGHCSYHGFEKGRAQGQLDKNTFNQQTLDRVAGFYLVDGGVWYDIGVC